MSILECMAVASASIVIIMNIIMVMKSFLDAEEPWAFIVKLAAAIVLNGIFLFIILNTVKSSL